MPEAKRIGLFGGTFDPIHIGHTIVAEWLQFKLELNEIHFIPNSIHPFLKRENVTDASHRLRMLELALQDYSFFRICRYEIEKKDISYSVETIRYYADQKPAARLFFLMGGDNVEEFHLWKNSEDIFQLATVVVFNRKNQTIQNADKFTYIQNPLIEISSSLIRNHIKSGLPYQSFLHPHVYEYIKHNKLYING